jgi:diketogulonate reductase-like aldo/keto reductase
MIHLGVSVIPKSNSQKRISENFDCLFELESADHELLGDLMGVHGERGVRNLETREYLGFARYGGPRTALTGGWGDCGASC